MKIRVKKNLKLFKNVFALLDKNGRETNMMFSQTGITMLATASNVTAMKVVMGKDFFDEYTIVGEKEEFPIVIHEINKVLKTLAFNEVTIESNGNTLNIVADETKYVAPLLDEAETLTTMPTVTFEHSLKTNQNALLAGVDRMGLVNKETIKVFIENKTLKMKTAAQIRKIETEICEAPDINVSTYISKKLLGDSLITTNDEITLYIGNNLPLKFELEKQDLKIETVIAPRVEGDF